MAEGEFGGIGEGKEIGTGIQLQSQLGSKRVLVFNAAISRDAPVGEYHKLVEKLSAVCDRQELRFTLEDLEKDLVTHEEGLAGAQEAFLTVDENNAKEWQRRGKSGPPKLSDSERAAKMQAATNIEVFKSKIKQRQIAIEEIKGKLAKDE